MCLIIAGNANKVRNALLGTPGLLADIFDSNKDGIGSMVTSDDGALVVAKALPKDLSEAAEFIKQLPETDRDLALHFRMRTHGDIDLTNCHPYPILDGHVHMMHNGVIRNIDDSSDKTKSDTWHYIEKVLKPQLQLAPQLMAIPGWQRVIREDIGGSNKFVLLDKDGQLVILNRSTGIEHDGLWFSNTYAWSPEILIPDYRWSGWGYGDEVGYGAWWKGHNYTSSGGGNVTQLKPRVDADEVWEAVKDGDADTMYKFLDSYPISTLGVLFKNDRFVCSVELSDLSQQDAKIVTLLEGAEEAKLAQYCRKSAGRRRKVAEIAAWYGSWVEKDAKPTKVYVDDGQGNLIPMETSGDEEVPDFEVIDGQVVQTKSSGAEETPDDADLETWRADFQKWLDRQQAGLATQPRQPAKWTAQTPALLKAPEPAVVAPIKSRSVMYRGYRVEVPVGLFEQGQWGALKDHLEKEAQRLHEEDLAKNEAARERDQAATETLNDLYAG